MLLAALASLAVAELRSADIARKTGVRGFGYHYYLVTELVRELHDDAATGKTSIDAIETALEELMDDHATQLTMNGSLEALIEEMHDDHATTKTSYDAMETLVEELHSTINELISDTRPDQVVASSTAGTITGVTLDVDDGSAVDLETNVAVVIQHKGIRYAIPAEAAIDTAGNTCNGDIVTTSTTGAFWLFASSADAWDVEQAVTAGTQAFASAIAAIATYSLATNTVPPGTDDVAVGLVTVTEGGSGDFTWGTDSITDETEVYYSLEGLPAVETAGTIALDAGAATYTYAACVLRLGTGVRISASGKANATLQAQEVAPSTCMAFGVYILADDVEIAVPLFVDGAHATVASATAAVRDLTPNPLMPMVHVIYVLNGSASEWTAGTDFLDAASITTTFASAGPGSSWIEHGRAALNQPHQVIQASDPASGPATLTSAKPPSGPGTLGSSKPASGAGTLAATKPAAVVAGDR
jgi:hypothetical protein